MDKLLALLDLFRKGSMVSNPELWKTGQISSTILVPVIMAIIHLTDSFGAGIKIDETTAATISADLIALINVVLTYTTTDKIGLPAKDSTP